MLAARGIPNIPSNVKLSSDPDMELLVKDAGNIYCTKRQVNFGPPYEMVQPAIVVLETSTNTVLKECTWSWKVMGLSGSQLNEGYEVQPGKKLVIFRPVISDLRASIKQRRMVKLDATRSLASAMGQYIKNGDFGNFLRGAVGPTTVNCAMAAAAISAAVIVVLLAKPR